MIMIGPDPLGRLKLKCLEILAFVHPNYLNSTMSLSFVSILQYFVTGLGPPFLEHILEQESGTPNQGTHHIYQV